LAEQPLTFVYVGEVCPSNTAVTRHGHRMRAGGLRHCAALI